tara:strand:+ start:522 stop:857 length:336 start_codon:yes stop_codon:yes gene_type:complete
MKRTLFALFLLLPNIAYSHDFHSSFRSKDKCYGNVYREKYIQGDAKNHGYIRKWEETIRIPCNHHDNEINKAHINRNNYKKFVINKFKNLDKWFNKKFADWKLNQSRNYKN